MTIDGGANEGAGGRNGGGRAVNADGRRRYEDRVLALERFGHRGSTTDRERHAADYLAGELAALGLAPAIEPFAAYRSLGGRLLLAVAVAAIGAAFLGPRPAVAAALGAVALASLAVEQASRGPLLSRLLPRPMSQNVVAASPAPRGRVRARLVVCGHYDTQRTGLLWHDALWRRLAPAIGRLPARLQSPVLPITAAMAAQVAIGGAGELVAGLPLAAASAALLAIYAVAAGLLAEWAARPHVPGAADNASGAAAVLALAEDWAADDDVEAVFLLTGCEEVGLVGAAAWADRHRADLEPVPTTFLNLDGLGFGPPRVLDLEVPLVGRPVAYPPDLLAIAREEAGEAAAPGSGPGPLTVPGYTDGMAFLARGLPGLTLVGCRPGGYLPNWHRPTDVAGRMDFDAAWRGVELASRLARRLAGHSCPRADAEPGGSPGGPPPCRGPSPA